MPQDKRKVIRLTLPLESQESEIGDQDIMDFLKSRRPYSATIKRMAKIILNNFTDVSQYPLGIVRQKLSKNQMKHQLVAVSFTSQEMPLYQRIVDLCNELNVNFTKMLKTIIRMYLILDKQNSPLIVRPENVFAKYAKEVVQEQINDNDINQLSQDAENKVSDVSIEKDNEKSRNQVKPKEDSEELSHKTESKKAKEDSEELSHKVESKKAKEDSESLIHDDVDDSSEKNKSSKHIFFDDFEGHNFGL